MATYYVGTDYVKPSSETVMNITLAVDDRVAEAARKAANTLGKSLNQLVREYLEDLAGEDQLETELEELRALAGQGNSGGEKASREALYADRVGKSRSSRRA